MDDSVNSGIICCYHKTSKFSMFNIQCSIFNFSRKLLFLAILPAGRQGRHVAKLLCFRIAIDLLGGFLSVSRKKTTPFRNFSLKDAVFTNFFFKYINAHALPHPHSAIKQIHLWSNIFHPRAARF